MSASLVTSLFILLVICLLCLATGWTSLVIVLIPFSCVLLPWSFYFPWLLNLKPLFPLFLCLICLAVILVCFCCWSGVTVGFLHGLCILGTTFLPPFKVVVWSPCIWLTSCLSFTVLGVICHCNQITCICNIKFNSHISHRYVISHITMILNLYSCAFIFVTINWL